MSHTVGTVNSNCPPHSPRNTNAAKAEAWATAAAPPTPAVVAAVPGPGMSEPTLGFAYPSPYQPDQPPMYGSPGPYQNQGPYRNTGMYSGPQPYGAMGQPPTVLAMEPVYRENRTYQSNDNETKWPWDSFDFAGTSFADKAIRKKFISKVYSLLFLQLSITFGILALCNLYEPIRLFIVKNHWLYLLAFAVFFVVYIALICFQSVRRNFPSNYIALFIFTVSFSFMVAIISARYTVNSVMISVGVTAVMTLGLTIFAMQTKVDFTPCASILCGVVLLIVFVVIASWISAAIWGPSSIWRAALGSLAAFLFSLFIIYDTQMLMGGRQVEISPEEYVFAAVQLYVDIIDLFLIILQCFLGDKRG